MKIGYIVKYGMDRTLVTYNRALAYGVAEKKNGQVKVCSAEKIKKHFIDKAI